MTLIAGYDALQWRGERADVEYVRILHLAATTMETHGGQRPGPASLEAGGPITTSAVRELASLIAPLQAPGLSLPGTGPGRVYAPAGGGGLMHTLTMTALMPDRWPYRSGSGEAHARLPPWPSCAPTGVTASCTGPGRPERPWKLEADHRRQRRIEQACALLQAAGVGKLGNLHAVRVPSVAQTATGGLGWRYWPTAQLGSGGDHQDPPAAVLLPGRTAHPPAPPPHPASATSGGVGQPSAQFALSTDGAGAVAFPA